MPHAFCGLHKIGYNTDLDYVCPQCVIAKIAPAKQWEFDTQLQAPVDATGNPLEVAEATPV